MKRMRASGVVSKSALVRTGEGSGLPLRARVAAPPLSNRVKVPSNFALRPELAIGSSLHLTPLLMVPVLLFVGTVGGGLRPVAGGILIKGGGFTLTGGTGLEKPVTCRPSRSGLG